MLIPNDQLPTGGEQDSSPEAANYRCTAAGKPAVIDVPPVHSGYEEIDPVSPKFINA